MLSLTCILRAIPCTKMGEKMDRLLDVTFQIHPMKFDMQKLDHKFSVCTNIYNSAIENVKIAGILKEMLQIS